MGYPNTPGWKALGPSAIAAKAISPHAKTLRERVHKFLLNHPPVGVQRRRDCQRAGRNSIFEIRPRVSELHKFELIEQAEVRTKNASGMTATCWRSVTATLVGITNAAEAEARAMTPGIQNFNIPAHHLRRGPSTTAPHISSRS